MEDILGKTLCPKCTKYILIEAIKEHKRVGCAPRFHPGWCFICEKVVKNLPEHYAACRRNQEDNVHEQPDLIECPDCLLDIKVTEIEDHCQTQCGYGRGFMMCPFCNVMIDLGTFAEHYKWCTAKQSIEEGIQGRYESIGQKLGALVDRKNKAYGDSFHQAGKCLEAMYPDGVPVSKYADMLGVIRVLDKLFRIAKDENEEGESPWTDIGGYGILKADLEE